MHDIKIPSSIRQAQQELSVFLQKNNSDAPNLAAQLLLMQGLGMSKIQLVQNAHTPLSLEAWQQVQSFALRHAKGEPLAYILGRKEFYGHDFFVTPDTLIPRPESEDVLDAAIKNMPRVDGTLYFADVGTGSGCLACTFAMQVPNSSGIMIDISPAALSVATCNAQRLGVSKKILPLRANLTALPFAKNSLHVLISNPPYVSEDEYQGLEKNVRDFEPKTALVPALLPNQSDPQGLYFIERLAAQAFYILKDDGICIVEHGFSQGEAVRKLFASSADWKSVSTGKDLAGLDRYCLCKK